MLGATPELNYMAQIVFLLFENKQEPEDSEDRYKVEVHFTPGGKGRDEIITGTESENSSTESLKGDISKTLLHTSFKRMVPENKPRRCSQHCPLSRPEAKTSCTLSLNENCGVKKVKSKSLPHLFYIPPTPACHCQCPVEEDSVDFTHPIDITKQPIPEVQLTDSPTDKELPTKGIPCVLHYIS